jgi:hypothetical protein
MRASAAALTIVLMVGPLSAQAAAPPTPQAPPVVLMIRCATTPDGRRHEEQLMDQLTLTLDSFMLMSQPIDRPEFARLPLDEQIAAVLPEAKHNDAMAVVWMSFPLANQVMVHLVALGSGRALVRTIESDRAHASERTLALITRELLGTAYLFEPPSSVPAEVREVVRTVKQDIPPDPQPAAVAPPPAAPQAPPAWSLWSRLGSAIPLAGGVDTVPVLDLALLVERRLPLGIQGAVGVAGRYATIPRALTAGAWFYTLGAQLELYRGFNAGPLSFGPELGATLSAADFVAPGQPSVASFFSTFRLGLEARTEALHSVAGAFHLCAALAPARATLSLGTAVQYQTPSVELLFGFSLGWQGI